MITPKELKNYCNAAKTTITAIKTVKVAVDESQIVDNLRNLKPGDNQILFAILPEYDTSESKDVDSVVDKNYMAFLVLEKLNYKSITEDEELDVWEDTLATIVQLREKIITDSTGGCCDCPDFSSLDPKSFRIQPVWKLAECNGYLMTVNIAK